MTKKERPQCLLYLFGIAIAKEGRSKGFGSKLIAGSVSKLTKDDIEEIELTVDPANTLTINISEKIRVHSHRI